MLDEGERSNWRDHVVPKLAGCRGRQKVLEPRWCALKESVSFVLADRESDRHAEAHSELVARLMELERTYRVGR